jgi:FkbM family methyltransferase
MSFVSYAQNMEDIMLWRALKDIEQGFYIDVGANDPNQDSVTKAFYEHGWRGINLEPVSQWFEKLKSERLRDINIQIAAGAAQGELQFYEISDTGLSTADKAIAERHEDENGYKKIERTVPVKTLTEICETYHSSSPIHFLKIDVEGAEKKVLEGVDFSKIRPWIIVVESMLPNTQIEDYEDWEPILVAGKYEYVYFDGLNRFYVAQEHPEFLPAFKAPPNFFDEFVLHAQHKAEERAQQANERTQQAEALAHQATSSLQAMFNSRSWHITAPLRAIENMVRAMRLSFARILPTAKLLAKRFLATTGLKSTFYLLINRLCHFLTLILRCSVVFILDNNLLSPAWIMRLKGFKTRFIRLRLYKRVISLAQAKGFIGNGPIDSLSLSAKEVYLELINLQLSSKSRNIK